MPRVRRLAHEALGGEIVAGGAALDDVRRDGERRAREADERYVRGQRALHQPHGFEHEADRAREDRKSTRLNSSHVEISYAVFCLKKKILDRLGLDFSSLCCSSYAYTHITCFGRD